jgi:hypothetical protein
MTSLDWFLDANLLQGQLNPGYAYLTPDGANNGGMFQTKFPRSYAIR